MRWRVGREELVERLDGAAATLPAVLATWRDVVQGRISAPVTAEDGLRTLEVVDACYRSAAAGGTTLPVG